MARTTKSISRARTIERGASKKGAKRAAARGGVEGGAVKRGAAKRGAPKRRGSRSALAVKGWTVNFVSGESLQLEADDVSIDSSGTGRSPCSGLTCSTSPRPTTISSWKRASRSRAVKRVTSKLRPRWSAFM